MKNWLALLLFGSFTLPVVAQSDTAFFEAQELFPLTADHVHGGTLVELSDGSLLAAWFQGSGERQADDVAIRGARLPRWSTSWSSSFVLADTPAFPDINPVLFVDPQDRQDCVRTVERGNAPPIRLRPQADQDGGVRRHDDEHTRCRRVGAGVSSPEA